MKTSDQPRTGPTTPLARLLGLASPPVAITFTDAPPPGVPRVEKAEPAGCGYWRRAAAGEVFHTVAEDHLSCPIGAHTHRVPMSPAKSEELTGMIGMMTGLGYLQPSDIPAIPTRAKPFQVAVYAPLDRAPAAPDVILVRANARQLMLLSEAAQAAGVAGTGPATGRPTCAAIPLAEMSARTATSLGCIGNRVYTEIGDGEAYCAIPGAALAPLLSRLETIVRANAELETFHRGRVTPRA
jgi:uncharacterized protein (DUF169 family)